ncbi:MAG: cytochrome P450, partial [Pseudomonadota bacterium]
IGDPDPQLAARSFITADAPRHGRWRKPVMPAVGPRRLEALEAIIRARAGALLDDLPRGETFDWVERVSVELTTQLLAVLFDVPFEDRRKLPWWSDVVTATPAAGGSMSLEERRAVLMECLDYFQALWKRRAAAPPGFDFISLYAHHPDTADMAEAPLDLLGNLMLLIVGGNDTTRNSISGGLLALNEWPEEYARLRADPGLIPGMVKEIVRWQTPIAHMRRTATRDAELAGRTIRAGEKVVMWYVSGNRD